MGSERRNKQDKHQPGVINKGRIIQEEQSGAGSASSNKPEQDQSIKQIKQAGAGSAMSYKQEQGHPVGTTRSRTSQ